MKKLKLFAALCCVAAAFAACTPDNEPEPQPEPHYNVELFFNADDRISINLDTVKKYASNKYIDTIYMITDDRAGSSSGFSGYSTKGITKLRDFLQQRIDVSPKVRGKGDFDFYVGLALPADSLWFVQQGWTVNKYLENQR